MKRILLSLLLSQSLINVSAQAPANYYNAAAGLSGASLKTALSTIISNGHQDRGYAGLWVGYQTTDRDYFYENDGTILDIYSENPTGSDPYNFTYNTNQCGNYTNEGDCYNREHIVPQSLFNEAAPMVSDIHFIRATDGKVNGYRSNYPFGIVNSATYTSRNGSKLGTSGSAGYNGTVFEPIDNFKGDVARMVFYFVTRYESRLSGFNTGNMLGGSTYPGLQQWELEQLLAWHAMDPVSPEEISRNNASYTFQGNRNPFIDNPSYANLIWGSPVIDTQAPSAPANLVANNPTSTSIALSWTSSTDNVGVIGYDVYANGTLKATATATSYVVTGLTPSTTYNFHIIAKDAAGNHSPQSNTATETTLQPEPTGTSCGTENFEGIPTSSASSYQNRVWTNNNITWSATDARTDESINNKAITIRNGYLLSSTISGGIQNLTVKTQLKYSGSSNNLNVEINGVNVGTIPYSATQGTFTINNINVSGDITIKLINPVSSNRVAIDDLSWTCYTPLSTTEIIKENSFSIYPNPIKNNELFVKGNSITKINKAEIYDLSGKLLLSIEKPFSKVNKLNISTLSKGIYILKTDTTSTKFIVE